MGRLKPSFFILGERKCGTSSLYRYLLHHPNVLPCKVKEPQFFTQNVFKIAWKWKQYLQLFPELSQTKEVILKWPELNQSGTLYEETIVFPIDPQQTYITGEASANSFYHANPQLVNYFLPQLKLIVLFRNPIDRAFSHYRMIQRFQQEGRKTRGLKGFELDMLEEMEKARLGKKTDFIGPSLYINQLKKWEKVFGKERILVLRTEDLAKPKKAARIMEQLCEHLAITPFDFSTVLNERYNVAPSKHFPAHFREEMEWFFRPYNQVLEDHIGRKMKWT